MNNEDSARLERCREEARTRLSQGFVANVSCAGDICGMPSEERIEQLATALFVDDWGWLFGSAQ